MGTGENDPTDFLNSKEIWCNAEKHVVIVSLVPLGFGGPIQN